MQVSERIDAIEKRAGQINLTLWKLCRDVGVEYSTITRWRSGRSSPLVTKFDQAVGKLERGLTRRECELRAALNRADASKK